MADRGDTHSLIAASHLTEGAAAPPKDIAMRDLLIIMMALSVAACAKPSAADNTADMLENAADQSTPAAAAKLDEAADEVREKGVVGTPSDPQGTVQKAVENAAAVPPR